MARVWTHGVWTVKPGKEDEFVARWREFLPIVDRLGGRGATLLRDRERPNQFRSFGSWPDLEAVEQLRAEIFPVIEEMDDLLESFEAFTLDGVHGDE